MAEIKGILGTKLGMTQIFDDTRAIPVTVIKAGPCFVAQVKTEAKDGYSAVQLAFGATRIFGGDEPKPAPNVAQEPSSSADAGTGNGGGGGTSAADARPDTVVAVLNGTPTQGLAKGAGDKLIAEGYSDATGMIRTGNNTADQQLPESSVLYAPGKRRQARDVASILDISARPKAVDEGTLAVANGVGGGGDSADVVVVLGLDQSP